MNCVTQQNHPDPAHTAKKFVGEGMAEGVAKGVAGVVQPMDIHHRQRKIVPDKLGKVRPFLSTLQQNFPCLFAPGVASSIDEAMIKYNGRLRWKQYMPMKPIKRDVFVVAKNTTGRDIVKPRTRFTPNDMITVPEMIVDYNRNLGGVDHLDQFRGYYNVGRAGRKWWKYVLFGLFNFAMINAYILKCLANRPLPSNQREWSLLTFRMAVMHQMCDNLSSRIDP
ncbi:hypothetical protein NP493_2311g00012 [Ridgeia piscesae]|uniref:PiggyBac transposable element-derived protein domain-containing protein n=1 Tax=Ridgeia piscesae TaxID=27915 RepID=A0AAD9JI74_RIDPI|nr:hypothetical protein NP493_2311g00012 [Ridgeia piscesae]